MNKSFKFSETIFVEQVHVHAHGYKISQPIRRGGLMRNILHDIEYDRELYSQLFVKRLLIYIQFLVVMYKNTRLTTFTCRVPAVDHNYHQRQQKRKILTILQNRQFFKRFCKRQAAVFDTFHSTDKSSSIEQLLYSSLLQLKSY